MRRGFLRFQFQRFCVRGAASVATPPPAWPADRTKRWHPYLPRSLPIFEQQKSDVVRGTLHT
ncbi:hypothetical protein BDZ94DRAFT_1250874 [Collybia nuda]|uniref:Uncharacterized protein n=1 Tax=Collybia nuda TaxID=64659 RepID=A0A9P5YE38_9AGAR|nr:hypothetical protein BDZ94DRAFT_1250874 [Collybia nuda]